MLRQQTRFSRLIILAAALAIFMPLASMKAAAHSPLASSSPADGTMSAAAPEMIELNFRGKAKLIRFRLTDAGGGEVVLGKDHLMIEASRHLVMLPPIGSGDFTAKWRAMSADGHVLKGAFSFSVDGN